MSLIHYSCSVVFNVCQNNHEQRLNARPVYMNRSFPLLRLFSTEFTSSTLCRIDELGSEENDVFLLCVPYFPGLPSQLLTVVIANLEAHDNNGFISVNQGTICFYYQLNYSCSYQRIPYGSTQKTRNL